MLKIFISGRKKMMNDNLNRRVVYSNAGGRTMAKTHTSTEVSERYKRKTYKNYAVRLRFDTDQDLIDYVEDNKDRIGMTQIFREAMELYVKAQKERG